MLPRVSAKRLFGITDASQGPLSILSREGTAGTAPADVDRDGVLDLVTVNASGISLTLLSNFAEAAVRIDIASGGVRPIAVAGEDKASWPSVVPALFGAALLGVGLQQTRSRRRRRLFR